MPSRSSSFRAQETQSTLAIEKPNQPPPQVPNRTHFPTPPPIGFNIQIPVIESTNSSYSQNDSPPYPVLSHFPMPTPKVESIKTNENGSASTTSSTSSISQDALNSPNNTLAKPPKPVIPRRPGNGIMAQLNKFERKSEENNNDHVEETNQPLKPPAEITSL